MSFHIEQENPNYKKNTVSETVVENPILNEQPVLETISPEQLSEAVESKQETPEIKKDKSLDNNVRALREKSERITKERDELVRKVQELESQKQELANDDLVEGKHIKQVNAEINQLRSHLNEMTVKNKLQSSYPDFDSVVNPENINALRESYPELAATLAASSDLYSKAVSAYTMIKKMGIIPDKYAEHQKEIVDKNANKPRPLTSIAPQQGDSPLSSANAFANGLTDALKDQLRKEMFAHRKSF